PAPRGHRLGVWPESPPRPRRGGDGSGVRAGGAWEDAHPHTPTPPRRGGGEGLSGQTLGVAISVLRRGAALGPTRLQELAVHGRERQRRRLARRVARAR